MILRASPRALAAAGAVAAAGMLLASASAGTNVSGNVGWGGFGNTPDNLRHSPLTQITMGNIGQLGRVYTVDFRAVDPSVRRGEQSYPVVSNGTIYMTTNDDNVWALDAATGKIRWRYTPDNVAVFRNFGIVANRGVALCDGRVFVLTLDMTITDPKAYTAPWVGDTITFVRAKAAIFEELCVPSEEEHFNDKIRDAAVGTAKP